MSRIGFAFAILAGSMLVIGSTFAADTKAKATTNTSASTSDKFTDDAVVREHVKNHIAKYPASKADIVKACNGMSDVSPADKALFAKKLPDGSYKSADDVIKAIGL